MNDVTIWGVPLQWFAEFLTLINNWDAMTNITYNSDNIVTIEPVGTGGPFISIKKNLAKKYVAVKIINIPIEKNADIICI